MRRLWYRSVPLVVLLAAGCAPPPAAETPVLRPGDVVRPEIAFAPDAPWPAGAGVTLSMLVRVERPGGETRHLRDEEVDPDRVVMSGRVTFLDGDTPLGDPLAVPFVHDC